MAPSSGVHLSAEDKAFAARIMKLLKSGALDTELEEKVGSRLPIALAPKYRHHQAPRVPGKAMGKAGVPLVRLQAGMSKDPGRKNNTPTWQDGWT